MSGVLLLAQAAFRVGSGRIVGGWEYVWASYSIVWAGLVLYAISLWLRHLQASRQKP